MTDIENNIISILCAEEKEPNWLVPDLFLQGAMVVLAGEPGTGKSYINYMIGLALAAHLKILGLMRANSPKRVLYFDEENSEQDRDTYLRRAWFGLCKQQNIDPHGEHLDLLQENFWPMSFLLGNPEWRDTAMMCVEQIQPHSIIYDTATPAFNIEDENSNSEASIAIKGIRDVARATDPVATSIVLKHAKMRTEKGGRRTIRGAKTWQGAADGVIFQVKATGRPRRDGLNLTRMEPDKTRAHGLRSTIYITPAWMDETRTGLTLTGSYSADKAHKHAEAAEDAELED